MRLKLGLNQLGKAGIGRSSSQAYSPAVLFAASEPGFWYDPSDLATLFQERTGASATTPSTVNGVVGSMLDKSGRGMHATAPSDAARPILRQSGALYYLEFDGTDDTLAFDATTLIATNYSAFMAWSQRTSPTDKFVLGGSQAAVANANLHMGWTTSTNMRGDQWSLAVNYASEIWTTAPRIVSYRIVAATGHILRINGVQRGTPNASTAQLSAWAGSALARRTSAFHNVDFYGGVIRGAEMTDAECLSLDTYLAGKSGVTI